MLTPVELWQATGRDKIPEIFHITDRGGRHYILPLTHEETFTFHAREIARTRSCRSSGTTSRSRTATSPGLGAASCGSASSS